MMSNLSRPAQEKALEKEKCLDKMLEGLESAVIAYSGGVDSTYLLYEAAEVIGSSKVLAITVASELTTPEEVENAKQTAGTMKVAHRRLDINLLSDPELRNNSPQRCYICKKHIYGALLRLAGEDGYETVLDGSNADDTAEYRPGLRALKELKVASPLLEAGLGKQEIRYLSRQAGLPTWDRPAAACLASRFPYGEELNPEGLQNIAAAEKILRQLGVGTNLRVRCHGNLARIEVGRADADLLLGQKDAVVEKLRELGFMYVTLDLGGFQSGSMDRTLG